MKCHHSERLNGKCKSCYKKRDCSIFAILLNKIIPCDCYQYGEPPFRKSK